MDRKIELTRRKVLGSVGAVGVAGAGAGIGTSALFSDEEEFSNNSITAGTLDMSVTATIVEASQYYTSSGDGPDIIDDMATADGDAVVGLQASDVKPGDWVIICFEISIGDNPGYVRISTDDFAQYENGQTEPEAAVDNSAGGSLGPPLDGRGAGELQDQLLAEVYGTYNETDGSNPPRSYLGTPEPSLSGSAQTAYEQFATGVVLGGPTDPLEVGDSGVTRYLLLELPTDVGNEVQSDAIEFDLVFETEQVRNNDGFEPSSSLVGYWPLNSVKDGTAEDLSGKGNNGTVQGDVSAVGGQVAGAGSFNGTDDHVSLPPIQLNGSLTVAAWVKRETAGQEFQAISSQGDGYATSSSQTRNWWLGGRPQPDAGQVHWSVFDESGTNHRIDSSSGALTSNQFIHVTGVYAKSTGTMRIFIDGSLDAEISVSPFTPKTSSDPGAMGAEINTSNQNTPGRFFGGVIDDVRVYGRALSSSEVDDLYTATK